MPAGADLAAGLADPTVAVYADAERIMLQRVAQRLAKGLASPSWAEEKLAEIHALRRELGLYMTTADVEAERALRQAIERAYRIGVTAAETDLADAAVAATAVTNTYTVGIIVSDSMRLLQSTYTQVLRHAEDAYRRVVAQASAQMAAGTLTRREATQAALWKFADQGVTGFVDRSGRKWDLTAYTEMATRTAVGHAAINGHLETLTANGHDLVIVSNAPGECEVCRPWEAKVLSITGRTGGYYNIEDARNSGLFHPGCRHSTGAYFPGITEPYGRTADPEGDEARQKLRYLERQTRAAKMREATAISPQAARLARARVHAYQAAIRQHTEATGLIRQRHREQIRGTARLNAGPTLPKPEPKPELPKVVESGRPQWARGGAIDRADERFKADGGFMGPLTDANGRLNSDSFASSAEPDKGWIRPDATPTTRAYAHLDHLKAAGHDVSAEIDRRTGGYFGKLDSLTAEETKWKAEATQAAKDKSNLQLRIYRADGKGKTALANKLETQLNATKGRYDNAMSKWSDAATKVTEHKQGDAAARAEMHKVLGELRPLGGDLRMSEKTVDREAVRMARDASKFYPKDWIEKSNALKTELRVKIGGGRGFYDLGGTMSIYERKAGDNALAVHELGHRMEHAVPDIEKAEWAFYAQRTAGENSRSLSSILPGHGYGRDERARKDQFSEVYMGKDYGFMRVNPGPTNAYELLTMGAENLTFGNYALDADYRDFLLGLWALL